MITTKTGYKRIKQEKYIKKDEQERLLIYLHIIEITNNNKIVETKIRKSTNNWRLSWSHRMRYMYIKYKYYFKFNIQVKDQNQNQKK